MASNLEATGEMEAALVSENEQTDRAFQKRKGVFVRIPIDRIGWHLLNRGGTDEGKDPDDEDEEADDDVMALTKKRMMMMIGEVDDGDKGYGSHGDGDADHGDGGVGVEDVSMGPVVEAPLPSGLQPSVSDATRSKDVMSAYKVLVAEAKRTLSAPMMISPCTF